MDTVVNMQALGEQVLLHRRRAGLSGRLSGRRAEVESRHLRTSGRGDRPAALELEVRIGGHVGEEHRPEPTVPNLVDDRE